MGWQPGAVLDPGHLDGVDVVVNLAGSPTLGNPHSRRWARDLQVSRVEGSRTIATAVAAHPDPPALLNASGISWYGDHGGTPLTEASDSRGHALLTRVCHEWEAATRPAVEVGARVVLLRTAPVLDRRSAPLSVQLRQFRLGLGGRFGDGRQYAPSISLRDWVGAVVHAAEHPHLTGPVNLCSPLTPTNAEVTEALADLVGRPARLHVPATVLRVAAGAMAPELLGSLNTSPSALIAAGYRFRDADIAAVLDAATA